MLGATETQNKKTVPAPKILQSKYEIKDNWWIETDKGGQGNSETILVNMIGSGFSTPMAKLLSSFWGGILAKKNCKNNLKKDNEVALYVLEWVEDSSSQDS